MQMEKNEQLMPILNTATLPHAKNNNTADATVK